jgi:hypothetical protein
LIPDFVTVNTTFVIIKGTVSHEIFYPSRLYPSVFYPKIFPNFGEFLKFEYWQLTLNLNSNLEIPNEHMNKLPDLSSQYSCKHAAAILPDPHVSPHITTLSGVLRGISNEGEGGEREGREKRELERERSRREEGRERGEEGK